MRRTAAMAVPGLLSQAESQNPFRASRESDLNFIRVGDERYEIPDAAILGG